MAFVARQVWVLMLKEVSAVGAGLMQRDRGTSRQQAHPQGCQDAFPHSVSCHRTEAAAT